MVVARVNIRFPTFEGLSIEDVDDHVHRFSSLCKGKDLNREDVYLVLFPSTLDSLTNKWLGQFTDNYFGTWEGTYTAFCAAFWPSNYREHVLD